MNEHSLTSSFRHRNNRLLRAMETDEIAEISREQDGVTSSLVKIRGCRPLSVETDRRGRTNYQIQNQQEISIIYIAIVKLATVVKGDRRLPFQQLLQRGVGEGATPFPGLLLFTLDPYFIVLSVKQGGIRYHFLSLWYDSTAD